MFYYLFFATNQYYFDIHANDPAKSIYSGFNSKATEPCTPSSCLLNFTRISENRENDIQVITLQILMLVDLIFNNYQGSLA